jgi:hypothetical protein
MGKMGKPYILCSEDGLGSSTWVLEEGFSIKNKRVPANRKKVSIYIFCTKICKPSCEESGD